jgi:hypothetical protein
LWDNDDDNDASNNDNHFFTSKNATKKGHPAVTNHFSTDKGGTQVTLDATVAKQLLMELLFYPLSYAGYDHIPPITQAQLNFLVSRIDSVVQPSLLDDVTDSGPEVGENLNMEPNLDNDGNDDKTFFDKGHEN